MDKLSPELIGWIFGYLSPRDLLNCRLVCNLFKSEVDHQFAIVTHVKINQDGLHNTFLPEIHYPSLNCRDFFCNPKRFDDLFTFFQRKCPNLRVLSAVTETLSLEQLLKVSKRLVYFEVALLDGVEDLSASKLRPLFPFLEAVELSRPVPYPNAFCINEWSAQYRAPNVKASKFIQSTNICCNLEAHRENNNEQVDHGISWYFAHQSFNLTLARQLNQPCIADSLRILQITIDLTLDLVLPNLLYADIFFVDCDPRNILNCLKYSSNLQVVNLHFTNSEVKSDDLSSLLSSLKELRSLSLNYDRGPFGHQSVQLSLAPKLQRLSLCGFNQIKFTEAFSQSLKFIRLKSEISSIASFRFPNLLECEIVFDYASSSLVERVFSSLEQSTNLKKLQLSILFMDSTLTQLNHVYSLLGHLKKLEYIKFLTYDEVPAFNLRLSNYPCLRYINWKNGESDRLDVYFDEKYQSIVYESEGKFTLRPSYGHPIKVNLPVTTKYHFKHPLESTVTKAAFYVPFKSPSFYLPHLLECKVVMNKNEDKIFQTLITSLCHSRKMHTFTLTTEAEAKLTLAQVQLLLLTIGELNNLEKLQVSVRVSGHNSSDFKFEVSSRFGCKWHILFSH